MGIFTASGSKLFMTATTTPPATFTAAGYAALTYVEVKNIESLGAFGDESTEVPFDDLGEGRTKKFKGQKDGKTMAVVGALNEEDAGQILLFAAEKDTSVGEYHFRVVYRNKITSGGTGGIRYFSGKVMKAGETIDTANNIVKFEASIGINTERQTVAAT